MSSKETVLETNQISKEERLYKFKAGAFLAAVGGVSMLGGFGMTLAAAKKTDPHFFQQGMTITSSSDAGALLAMRALGWGTLYAVAGTSLFCYGVWKLSGAKDMKEFRLKMGSILPRVPKNDPPQSRTEFSGLNDLMNYLATEKFGKT